VVSNEDTAPGIAGVLGQTTLIESGLSEEQRNDENVQTLLSALESATVSQNGDTVRWSYTAPVAEFAATVRAGVALLGEDGTAQSE
jgi:hypothetical protein